MDQDTTWSLFDTGMHQKYIISMHCLINNTNLQLRTLRVHFGVELSLLLQRRTFRRSALSSAWRRLFIAAAFWKIMSFLVSGCFDLGMTASISCFKQSKQTV